MHRILFLVSICALSAAAQQAPPPLPPRPEPDAASIAATAKLPPATKYEVVTIKLNSSGDGRVMLRPEPDRITGNNVPMRLLIQQAFGVKKLQILNAPEWMDNVSFDFVAKADGKATPTELFRMLRPVLEERFKMKTHVEQKEMPIYELVVAKSGLKIQQSKEGDQRQMMMQAGPNGVTLTAAKMNMARFCEMLTNQVSRNVIDKTGLTDEYTFKLEFMPEDMGGPGPGGHDPGEQFSGSAPGAPEKASVFAAMQEQLGLKLEAKKGPVDMLVIDHLERVPTEN